MELRTTVANVKRVPAGQGISYGLTHRVDRPTALGLIPLGYGDGVPRSAVDAPVRIGDRVYRSVGRVAMDQFVVDLGEPDTDVQVGDDAVLFGGESGPSAAEWGAAAQTINYEIITRVSGRVPRIVRDSGLDQAAPEDTAPDETAPDETAPGDRAEESTQPTSQGAR